MNSNWKMTPVVTESGEIRNQYVLVKEPVLRQCSVCEKDAIAKGVCWKHYSIVARRSFNLTAHYRLGR